MIRQYLGLGLTSGVDFKFYSGLESLYIELIPPIPCGLQGGVGITNRTIGQVEGIFPGLMNTGGKKIVFIGNGASTVPLYFADAVHSVIINDAFPIKPLYDDLREIKRFSLQNNSPFPFLPIFESLERLLEGIRNGRLRKITHIFGTGNPPSAMGEADIIVNCHGPPISTLNEQLSLLDPGGSLFLNLQPYRGERLPHLDPNSYDITPLGNYIAYRITRRQS